MAGSDDRTQARGCPDAPVERAVECAPIPFRIRVGVTGHRRLREEQGLEGKVAEQVCGIRKLLTGTQETPVRLTVVSSLAEGSDRLMARVILRDPGACLEAPLPFPPAEYCKDFRDAASVEEFRRLLKEARYAPAREVLPGQVRTDGYQAVGRYVSDRCDVLIAIWDGSPSQGSGGTAEVVSRAREHHVPVFHIDANHPHGVSDPDPRDLKDCVAGLLRDFHLVERYNRSLARHDRSDQDPTTASALGDACEDSVDWARAEFSEADRLARRYRRAYRGSLAATFLLAALAVAAVAGDILLHEEEALGYLEVGAILVLIAVVVVSHVNRVQPRYLGYRFLAERIREAPFLALARVEHVQPNPFSPEFVGYPSEGWPWRVFDEVWTRRPERSSLQADVVQLRECLALDWIAPQKRHHKRTWEHERARQQGLGAVAVALFAATAIAAVLHVFFVHGDGHHEPAFTKYHLLVFLSITFGACGAALSGFLAQRGYRREASRSRQMMVYLRYDEERMWSARTLEVVTRVAEETQRHVLSENRSWFGDLLFEEIELHT